MGEDEHTQNPGWAALGKGVALFVGLSVLLRLPNLGTGIVPTDPVRYLEHPPRGYYLFSLDLFALASLLSVVPYSADWSRVRAFVGGSILFLLAYRTYDAVVVAMLHRSPIFYADAPHVVGALHLAANASLPWRQVVGIGAGLVLLGGLVWALPSMLRRLHRCVSSPMGRRGVLLANAIVWPIVVFAVVTDRGTYLRRATYQNTCLSTTECLVRNVEASTTLRRDVAARFEGPRDSTYARYRALDWDRPPSLYLVMIESYGSVLAAPASPVPFDRFMAGMADSLRASGWHMATAQSDAPVFGGLSWLSAATLFLGTSVEHQPLFEVLRPTLPRYPHLVRLLRDQGYETATLQPPVRPRPGLSADNPYEFDRTFYLRDLDYQGPDVGWGIVPDQYSLSVAHERFVAPTEPPFFLFFEAVTSHLPWDTPPPPLVDEPKRLNRPSQNEALTQQSRGPTWSTLSQKERLFRYIRYDWRVLTEYLRRQAPPNSLIVVVGDHQPHFADTESRATPLHVLSRTESLIRRFRDHGFVSELRPSTAADALHHAGVYSLLVRVLTAHDRAAGGDSSAALPPYRRQGVERVALLPKRP